MIHNRFKEDLKDRLTIGECEELMTILNQGVTEESTMDFIVYRTYLKLGTMKETTEYLVRKGYKYLGKRKYSIQAVSEHIRKREPAVNQVLNKFVKWVGGRSLETNWWDKWDNLDQEEKRKKISMIMLDELYSPTIVIGKKLRDWNVLFKMNCIDELAKEHIIPMIKAHLI